jgi:putative nucleotidyltransferase with HDIG domain
VAHQFVSKPASPDMMLEVVERICAVGAGIPAELRTLVGAIGVFPVGADAYRRLADALADGDGTADQLADIIASDPGMSAKLLQVVNSSFFGISPQVAEIGTALEMIPPATLRELVLSAGVFRPVEEPSDSAVAPARVRAHSAAVASAAAVQSMACGAAWYTAGLLHDIGKLVLADVLPERYAALAAEAAALRIPLHHAEREALGSTHAQIGAYLLGIWNLPPEIVSAVARHHDHDADPVGPVAAIRLAHAA